MIHIDGAIVRTTRRGQTNLVCAYIQQIKTDYNKAISDGNILEMIELEQCVKSDDFLGETIGVSSEATLRALRNSYDKDKFEIVRDEETGYPIRVTKKRVLKNGESKGRKTGKP